MKTKNITTSNTLTTHAKINFGEDDYIRRALSSFLTSAEQFCYGIFKLPPDAWGKAYVVNALLDTCFQTGPLADRAKLNFIHDESKSNNDKTISLNFLVTGTGNTDDNKHNIGDVVQLDLSLDFIISALLEAHYTSYDLNTIVKASKVSDTQYFEMDDVGQIQCFTALKSLKEGSEILSFVEPDIKNSLNSWLVSGITEMEEAISRLSKLYYDDVWSDIFLAKSISKYLNEHKTAYWQCCRLLSDVEIPIIADILIIKTTCGRHRTITLKKPLWVCVAALHHANVAKIVGYLIGTDVYFLD